MCHQGVRLLGSEDCFESAVQVVAFAVIDRHGACNCSGGVGGGRTVIVADRCHIIIRRGGGCDARSFRVVVVDGQLVGVRDLCTREQHRQHRVEVALIEAVDLDALGS